MSSIVPKLDRDEWLAADLADYLRQIDEVDADAGNLLDRMSEDQFHWSPASSHWSIAQCLVHLVIMGRRYLPVLDEAIENARADRLLSHGPFRYGFVEKWIVRATEPPPGIRLKTPASARPPDDQPLAGVVANFLLTQDELRKRIHAAKGIDLARAKTRFSSRTSAGTCGRPGRCVKMRGFRGSSLCVKHARAMQPFRRDRTRAPCTHCFCLLPT